MNETDSTLNGSLHFASSVVSMYGRRISHQYSVRPKLYEPTSTIYRLKTSAGELNRTVIFTTINSLYLYEDTHVLVVERRTLK